MLVIPAITWATYPGANGRIAYVLNYGHGINTIQPDGSGMRVLTRDSDWQPSWSADGRRLVFIRDHRVFTMSANGERQRRVTDDSGVDNSPDFSPNGRRIVYSNSALGSSGRSSIFTIRANGKDRRLLIRLHYEIWYADSFPAYSPGGQRIVFAGSVKGRDGLHRKGIWTIRPDGSHLRRLTRPRTFQPCPSPVQCVDQHPYWSPDGDHIFFMRCGTPARTCVGYLFVMRANGSHQRRILRDSSWEDSAPIVAPDGGLFAYAQFHGDCHFGDCYSNIATTTRSGSFVREVTDNELTSDTATAPSWQPMPGG